MQIEPGKSYLDQYRERIEKNGGGHLFKPRRELTKQELMSAKQSSPRRGGGRRKKVHRR